jgi:outer membrane protein assembly factor BamE (lipoprotein component of BamABCDE complex)
LFTHRRHGALRLSLTIAIALFAGGGVAGCASDIAQRGHLPTPEQIAQIQPGSTTREDVVKIIGSPSSTATFDDKTWYYISRRTKQVSFFSPTVLDQQVFIVSFNDKGVVKSVGHKALADGESISPAPGATPSRGRELTFLEQLLGNVGKFNNGAPSNGRGTSLSAGDNPTYTAH